MIPSERAKLIPTEAGDWDFRKPFATVEISPDQSSCWDCGYLWTTGEDGSHDCLEVLKGRLREIYSRKLLETLDS